MKSAGIGSKLSPSESAFQQEASWAYLRRDVSLRSMTSLLRVGRERDYERCLEVLPKESWQHLILGRPALLWRWRPSYAAPNHTTHTVPKVAVCLEEVNVQII